MFYVYILICRYGNQNEECVPTIRLNCHHEGEEIPITEDPKKQTGQAKFYF